MSFDLILLLLIFLSAIGFAGFLWWARHIGRKMFFSSLRQELFLVRLPQKRKKDGQEDFKEEINESSRLFSLLGSFGKSFTLEAAVPHIGEEIHFFLTAQRDFAEAAVKQIHSLWSEAQVTRASEFNIFNSAGDTAAVFVRQKRHYALPIRTFAEVGGDIFASILGGFSKVDEVGEGAAVQITVMPAKEKRFKKEISQKAAALQKGAKEEEIFGGSGIRMGDFMKAISGSKVKKEGEEIKKPLLIDEELLKLVHEKISKPLFIANVRVVASAAGKFQAESLLNGRTAGFFEASTPKRNELALSKPRNIKKFLYDFSFRNFDSTQAMVLNSDELASIFHFPTISSIGVPKVNWLKSKEAPPPAMLSVSGVLIGESVFRGEKKPIYISDNDKRRHVYVVGQTGTGKTTLLSNMVVSDIKRGKGVAIIDPHGDYVDAIAGLIPKERINDVVIFDPADFEMPVGLNMLEYNKARPEEKTFIVNEMQSIFNKLFSQETMGPMFEQYMRNTLLLLMEDAVNEPATLVEVPRVLTDEEYRRRKLARIANPSVIDFWTKEAEKAGGEAALANMAPYITSKFNNFIANDYVRPIISQPKNSFNFREIMDQQKILLVKLSKGKIGDINASLLGMVVVGKILMAALSRVDLPESERKDFNLYIDEFQNFTTDSIATIFSEARKYRLGLTVGHQFIAQLSEKIRDSVFGNVGSIISFRVGAQDAEFLVKQLAPVFNEGDLLNIENYNAYVKILINGQPSTPFSVKTFPPEFGSLEAAAAVKEMSRQKYGKDRQEVEASILSRLRS